MHATAYPSVSSTTMEPAPIIATEVSFEELYRREYPALVAVATALAGTPADGEDVVQDTMVKALMHWGKVRRLERPGAWCHRVLLNACRSRWRRRRTEARFLACRDPGPLVAFWAAVQRLPERPRLAVALYYAGDRSVAEVASILDVPEGTVRSDLSRARMALTNELEH